MGTGMLVVNKPDQKESKYVLTAAHNLYDSAEGGEATKVTFAAAKHNGKEPYGNVLASKLNYPPEYKKVGISNRVDVRGLGSDLIAMAGQYDYAIVELKSAITLSEAIPCPLVRTDAQLNKLGVMVHSYGSNGSIRPKMTEAAGNITATRTTEFDYDIKTVAGDSGSGVMESNKVVVGVHMTRATGDATALRITDTVKKNLDSWMG